MSSLRGQFPTSEPLGKRETSMRHIVHNLSKSVLIFIASITALMSLGELRAETTDDFQVIVNEEIHYTMLSRQEISDFYLRFVVWTGGGAEAELLVLPRDSAIHERFLRDVLNMSVSEFEGYWYKQAFQGDLNPPVTLNTDQEVIDYVKSHPAAIGYISKSTRAKGVTVLEVVD